MSSELEFEVIQPIWFSSAAEVESEFGTGSYPTFSRSGVRYHWVLASKNRILSSVRRIACYILGGWELHREKPLDCIVVYSHMLTGVCASVLKMITGSKLIIEIATSPSHYFGAETPSPGLAERLKFWYSEVCLHISCLAADRIHVLSPKILSSYRLLKNRPQSVFHEFVHSSVAAASETQPENVVLLAGSPWYLKGADLLIRAFERLMDDFPDTRLRILGFFPDRAALDALIGGNPRVEVVGPVPNLEAIQFIAQAKVLVLPSRCEGMGRVLIEAMAAGVPVIGSDVGGIPYVVRDGVNGLIFPTGDIPALERCLRTLLGNPELAQRMGARGREIAATEFTEEQYAKHFIRMVSATVRGE